MKKEYKCLPVQKFSFEEYNLVPIRSEDRYKIMDWRNQQIYHLRQKGVLTSKMQDDYFENEISVLFDQDLPSQMLFSYLENENCIGYGGLVHIDWNKKTAEVSFLIDTKLEQLYFEKHWTIYLKILNKIAFNYLKLSKIYVYAFDFRPHLYKVLKKNTFEFEKRIFNQIKVSNKWVDVVIYSKYATNEKNKNIS